MLKRLEFSGTSLEYDDDYSDYYDDDSVVVDTPWEESCCPCCGSILDGAKEHYSDCDLKALIADTERMIMDEG